jgi:hypothetical protein
MEMEKEEPFDFERLNPEYCWTPLYHDPGYSFSMDELLGCLSDMATRDTERCTTAVEHLYMICPCFLPPVQAVDDHRSDSERTEAALESLSKLSASIRESRLRRAGNKVKKAVKTVDGEGEASSAATGARQDDKIQVDTPYSLPELMDREWLDWVVVSGNSRGPTTEVD